MVLCLDVDFLFCWLVFILDIGKIKQDVVWLHKHNARYINVHE